MSENCEITLEQLLKSRDERAERQRELIEKYTLPLISLTVNIPGKNKKNALSTGIFRKGCAILLKMLEEKGKHPLYFEKRELITGPEAYIVVNLDEYLLKEYVLRIENGHQLGRLWDIDVISRKGKIISREELGYPKRKCLLCDEDAHVCTRNRTHSIDLLLEKIKLIACSYFAGRKNYETDGWIM